MQNSFANPMSREFFIQFDNVDSLAAQMNAKKNWCSRMLTAFASVSNAGGNNGGWTW